MLLTSAKHMRLAMAHHRAAADAKLTLQEKRELQWNAKRHEILAKRARELEAGQDVIFGKDSRMNFRDPQGEDVQQ